MLAGQQRVRPALVQRAAAWLGDLLVDRVAEQRVTKSDGTVGDQQHAALQRFRGGLVRVP